MKIRQGRGRLELHPDESTILLLNELAGILRGQKTKPTPKGLAEKILKEGLEGLQKQIHSKMEI